jgi:2',3'-cyclic-nucleotide 2'-phosphodiesterase (5'-nucleotidase family)
LLVDQLEASAGSLCDEIACADHTLSKAAEPESELGTWMAESLLGVFPDADLAIQNAGGIRADLPAGTVRRESLQRVMPFDNRALLVEMTGAQVRELFRTGTSVGHGLLQVAGGEVRFDAAREAGTDRDGDGEVAKWERDRLCSVTVGGEPLADDHTYRVVTSDFLFKGGDHLGMAFEGAKVLQTGPLLRDRFFESAAATTGCLGATPAPRRVLEGPCP